MEGGAAESGSESPSSSGEVRGGCRREGMLGEGAASMTGSGWCEGEVTGNRSGGDALGMVSSLGPLARAYLEVGGRMFRGLGAALVVEEIEL